LLISILRLPHHAFRRRDFQHVIVECGLGFRNLDLCHWTLLSAPRGALFTPSSTFAYVQLGSRTLIQRKPAADSDGN
jgi:hypothetical protein